MKNLLRWAGAIALALIPSLALAQSGTSVQFPAGYATSTSICVKQEDGTCLPVSAENPLPIAGGTGGGGGGTGDASASNQVTLNNRIGDIAAPAAGSVNQRLGLINTALGSPFQAGGSIANTAFGISGLLPAYAATPTFNLGTLNGAATAAGVAAVNATLGTPMQQTGGSVTIANAALAVRPAVGTYTATAPVAVSAGAATLIEGTVTAPLQRSVQLETASTAIIYLCSMGQANCSATVHNAVIPSGAAIGTEYYFAPTTAAIYAVSAAAFTIKANSVVQ